MTRQKSLKINASLNIIKQLCQVLFPLISIPYVTRVLGPERYGKFNYGNSIVSYFVLIAALGINSYAVREGVVFRDNKEKIEKFVSEIFSINILSTVVSYSLLVVLLFFPFTEPYRRVIAIQSLIIILTTIGTDWINTIYEDFAYITIRYIIFQCVSLACMFVFVHKPDDYLIYAMVVVGAQAGANILNIFHVRKYVRIKPTRNIDWQKHMKPILIFFANIVAITIYVNSDITMLGIFRTDRDVGLYTLASRIYTIVKQVLNAIVVVTLPRLSLLIKNNNRDNFNALLDKIQKALLLLIFPATVGMMFLSEDIINIISGAEYVGGYSALIVLSIAIIFSLLATFYTSCVMIPLKLERYVLTATIVSALSNIILNLFFIPMLGFNGAAVTTLISEIIVFGIGFFVSNRCGIRKLEMRYCLKIFVGSLVVAGICFVVSRTFDSSFSRILLSIVVSVPVYFLVEIFLKNDFVIDEMRRIIVIANNIISSRKE